MAQPTKESLVWEARARIIWGEKPDAVAEWLQEQAVEQNMIDDIIRVSLAERAADVRKRGFGEVLAGLGYAGAGGAGIGGMLMIGVVSGRIFAFCGVGIAYGAFKLIRGVIWISAGSQVRGSVTDLGDRL